MSIDLDRASKSIDELIEKRAGEARDANREAEQERVADEHREKLARLAGVG